MKRFVDCSKWIPNRELSNVEEVQSSFELFSWRKHSSAPSTSRYFSKNQNAIDRHHSQNEDISLSNQKEKQQLLNTSSPSTNFTTDNPVEFRINANNKLEKIDSYLSQKSVTITRRSSKPSRHEPVPTATSQTRQRQRDRYINYHHHLEENQLYSLNVSSNSIECYGTNCQPSVFNASHQCRKISSEKDIDANKKPPLMNDQNIKQNMSYISLTDLSNIIDHEPNVSRRDSYSRSTSSILMHKPSLFLADIFNKMTNEQRAKSLAQLVKLHENLTKSNTTIDNVQRTTSLPNFNNKPTKLHSITSLLAERTTPKIIQISDRTSSTSPIEPKYIDESMISEHTNSETSSDKRATESNKEITSAFNNQKIHAPAHVSVTSKKQIISNPVKFESLSECNLSQENLQTIPTKPSPSTTSAMSSSIVHPSTIKSSQIFIQSSNSNINTDGVGETKISRNTLFRDTDLNEQSSTSKLKSFKTSKIEQISPQSSNLSIPLKINPNTSSSRSIASSVSARKEQSDNETITQTISKVKNNQHSQEANLENNKDLLSQTSVEKNIQELYSKKDTNQPLNSSSPFSKAKQMVPASSHFHSSDDDNEIENSLNDVTDNLSRQDTIATQTNLDKSFNISSKEFNKTKQAVPLLKTIDEVSQHSKSSHSDLKNSTLLITSPALSETLTKPGLVSSSSIDDGDTSIITRTTTASTNLTKTANDDDDEQSKLINEQLKRNSLGLARDSLELLRNATPHHDNSDEQLIPRVNIDSTPQKRKSVLKSHLDSSDNLPTLELISYMAIDEVRGDKRLMEKQMRHRSLTVGGGIVVSCTSPKPKRDSLILLQERYSGSTTPHSGGNHLSSSDSRHVEFIREPGDNITPVLHIGRGTKSKHPSNKPFSPSCSSDHFSSHTFDPSERSKSETSAVGGQQQQLEIETHLRRPSLDSATRQQTSLTSTTTSSSINTDGIEEEKVCFNKSDYDAMVRLMMTPLSKKKTKSPIKSPFESNIALGVNNRLTTFRNLILLILLIFFYIFVFIKSQYWQEHHQK